MKGEQKMPTSLTDLKARMKPPESQIDFYSILIYGPSGVGKTSLFYDAKDTLILDVEHGTSVLGKEAYHLQRDYESEVTVLQLKSWEDLQGVFVALKNGELSFTNIVLDSITDIRDLCKDHVLETQRRNRVSEETPSQQDWQVITERMRKMVRNFRNLSSNVIYVAREYDSKDEETGAERVKPAVGGKFENDFPGLMNIVAYYNVNSDGDRILCFDLRGKYYAKDRTNQFPKTLKNPTWLDFEKYLPALKPKLQAETEAEAV